MQPLKIIETDIQTLLKEGRKVYAKVSFNENPDYTCTLILPVCYNWLKKEAIGFARHLAEEEPFNEVKGSIYALKALITKLTTSHKPNLF